ncbi:hypothetical protein SK128_010048 [Halocaridina rubra]|uniref:RFX-type winged-helix domain-containing protein n=1 Tax=Halocaridina rubra TaxID=373956 RepID=A0AAN8X1N5_HALRR
MICQGKAPVSSSPTLLFGTKDSSDTDTTYIPIWRRACELWISEHVIDEKGTDTPVHMLYNSYLEDNPNDYMDIGQFGKVLRARYPNRKRRRGKQGAQLYVYENVTLKHNTQPNSVFPNDKVEQDLNNSKANISSPVLPSVVLKSTLDPLRVVTSYNISPKSKKNSVRNYRKEDKASTLQSSSKMTKQSSYDLRSKNSDEFEIEIDTSQRDKGKNLTSSHFSGEFNPISSKYQNAVLNEHFPNTSFHTDKESSCMPELIDMEREVANQTPLPSLHRNTSGYENGELTIDMSQFCLEQQFKAEIEVVDIPILDAGKPEETNSDTRDSNDRTHTNGNTPTAVQIDDSVSSSTQTNENYLASQTYGMALGRQWLDANLTESSGAKTSAKEIELAYAQDHPDMPLSTTSMAVLIRSKYPGKRKRSTRNNTADYYYQDLKLVNRQHTATFPNIPPIPSTAINPQNVQFSKYANILPNTPRPLVVSQPNLDTVTVCNPSMNGIFNYQGVPCVAFQVMSSVNASQCETVNLKQNSALGPANPVAVAPPLKINPNGPYTVPVMKNSAPSIIQPLKITEECQNISQSACPAMKIPQVKDIVLPTTTEQGHKLSSFQVPYSVPSSLSSSLWTYTLHEQNTSSSTIPSIANPIVPGQQSQPSSIPLLNNSVFVNQNSLPLIMQSLKYSSPRRQNSLQYAYHSLGKQPGQSQMQVFKDPLSNVVSQSRSSASNCQLDSHISSERQNISPKNRISSNSAASVAPRDIPSLIYDSDSVEIDQPSSQGSSSTFLNIIKEESEMEDSVLRNGNARKILSHQPIQKREIPSHGCESIEALINDILPDMDVNDYISKEILEGSEKQKKDSSYNEKDNKDKRTNFVPNINGGNIKNKRKSSIDWNGKRTVDGASPVVKLPDRSHNVVDTVHWNEDIMISCEVDNRENNKSIQRKTHVNPPQGKEERGKRLKKIWDEDIRKLLQENDTHMSDYVKHLEKSRKTAESSKKPRLGEEKRNSAKSAHPSTPHVTFGEISSMREKLTVNAIAFDNEKQQSKNTMPRITDHGFECTTSRKFKGSKYTTQVHKAYEHFPNSSPTIPSESSQKEANPYLKSSSSIPSSSYPDSNLQQALNAVLNNAGNMRNDAVPSVTEADIAWRLEKTLYDENPATTYSSPKQLSHSTGEDDTNSFPCTATPALREISLSPAHYIDHILHQHQACKGLGCSEICKTICAAKIHIHLFHHRCQIWTIISKIFGKHSRACRRARCTLLDLCLFMKHEFHLNGISVLPIQYTEERSTLEEEFRRCEAVGPHLNELQCRHILRAKMSASDGFAIFTGVQNRQGIEADPSIYDLKCLLEKMQQNCSSSDAISKLIEIIGDMIKLRLH